MTCGAHVGPPFKNNFLCEIDMWVPRGLLFFRIKLPCKCDVNATLDEV